MDSYDSLPELKSGRNLKYFYTFTPTANPYELPYTLERDGKIYLSLEHLIGMICGAHVMPRRDYLSGYRLIISPCCIGLNINKTLFDKCQRAALKAGGKVMMGTEHPIALAFPLDALEQVLVAFKEALKLDRPSNKTQRHKRPWIKHKLDVFMGQYIYNDLANAIRAHSLSALALTAPAMKPREGDSNPKAGLKRKPPNAIPNKVCSYTAQRLPTYPYFSWLY